MPQLHEELPLGPNIGRRKDIIDVTVQRLRRMHILL